MFPLLLSALAAIDANVKTTTKESPMGVSLALDSMDGYLTFLCLMIT